MDNRFLPVIAGLAMIAAPLGAQTYQRRANVGNGNPESGKCTIEVVVDGAAEVEINGDNATLRNLSGQPAQWRRFECTSRMPSNPANFRFEGVDGRGKQELIRAPYNGGVAVVRIEDHQGGAEGYTFDLVWGGGYRTQAPVYGQPDYRGAPAYGQPDYRGAPDYRGGPPYRDQRNFPSGRAWGGGEYARDQAIRVCREAIRDRAARRFGDGNVVFRNMRLEDNPDRRDW